MTLIGFCGKKRSGKDTSASILIEKYDFVKYAFADALKEACKTIFLFSEEQVNGDEKEIKDKRWGISPRKVFQKFGTEIFRNSLDQFFPELKEFQNDFWIYRFRLWYENIKKNHPNKNVVITDVRFPNEAKVIKDLGGFIVKINRPVFKKNKEDNHISEQHIKTIRSDYEIYNNNTIKRCQEKVLTIYDSILTYRS
jgi:ribosomal protein S16